MATKSAFTASINALLTGVINIVSKHRPSMLIVTDELWKASLNDDETTTNVITKTYASADYNLAFNKVGNKVYINGIVKVFGTSTLPTGSVYAQFTTAEYAPKTGKTFYINGVQLGTSTAVTFSLNGTTAEMKNLRPMSTATDYGINGWYQTND